MAKCYGILFLLQPVPADLRAELPDIVGYTLIGACATDDDAARLVERYQVTLAKMTGYVQITTIAPLTANGPVGIYARR
jgi:hypothetical protein